MIRFNSNEEFELEIDYMYKLIRLSVGRDCIGIDGVYNKLMRPDWNARIGKLVIEK